MLEEEVAEVEEEVDALEEVDKLGEDGVIVTHETQFAGERSLRQNVCAGGSCLRVDFFLANPTQARDQSTFDVRRWHGLCSRVPGAGTTFQVLGSAPGRRGKLAGGGEVGGVFVDEMSL